MTMLLAEIIHYSWRPLHWLCYGTRRPRKHRELSCYRGTGIQDGSVSSSSLKGGEGLTDDCSDDVLMVGAGRARTMATEAVHAEEVGSN